MTYDTINDAVTMRGSAQGALLANRYRVVRQLGQGGMGSVWLAEDTQLDGKLFAIKMLPSILVSNKRAYRQLKDEALVAMQLVHPNIVQIRAFEENNGNPFLVMDYIDGQTLDDYLAEYDSRVEHVERVEGDVGRDARPARPSGGLPEDEVIRLLKPIAAALDYAHGEGVVHRDVKPANVMIRKDGHPFILDFGIAREIQETMTRVTGKLSSGTLLYMSPEQLRGQSPKPAQDVYSFAAMAYECLKGEPPFSRGQIEYQILNEQPEPLGPHFAKSGSVMQALAKKPEDRPPTCAAVLEAAARRVEADDTPCRPVLGQVQAAPLKPYLSVAQSKPVEIPEADRKYLPSDAKYQSDVVFKVEERNDFKDEMGSRIRHDRDATSNSSYPDSRPHSSKRLGKFLAVLTFLVTLAGGVWYCSNRMDVEQSTPEEEVRTPERKAGREARERERCKDWRQEGRQFTINEPYGLDMTMKWCPAGTFTMGSPTTEEGRYDDETQHQVTLTKGFWLGQAEVTQGQWKKIMNGEAVLDLARKGLQDDNEYIINGKRQTVRAFFNKGKYDDPASMCGDVNDSVAVYYVSWNDAMEFCRRLTQRERASGHIPVGYEYRLPTEAEWEYACRAGTTTALPNGRDIRIKGRNDVPALDDIAWYGGNSSVGFVGRAGLDTSKWPEKQYSGGKAHAREVKGKQPNRWGLYDMIGNVWEWCNDWYGNYDCGSSTDPTGAVSGVFRVYRGAGWGGGDARDCRSARRGGIGPGFRISTLGFRVALAPKINADIIKSNTAVSNVKEKLHMVERQERAVRGGSARQTAEAKAKAEQERQKYSRRCVTCGSAYDSRFCCPYCNPPKNGHHLVSVSRDTSLSAGPKHGDSKTLTLPGGAKMEMIYVAPDSFMMGSPTSEAGRLSNEAQHRVALTKGFWLGKYEVTQEQWQSVIGDNPSTFKGSSNPVEQVSWNDCQTFCEKVNVQINCGARLPTAAEWEYACRAGSEGMYGGTGQLEEMGWYGGNSGKRTHRVGEKSPNEWGLYDMHGNVCEWCDDWLGDCVGSMNNPQGSVSGKSRVLRGGGYSTIATMCRSASHLGWMPGKSSSFTGFRLCCSEMPPQ